MSSSLEQRLSILEEKVAVDFRYNQLSKHEFSTLDKYRYKYLV